MILFSSFYWVNDNCVQPLAIGYAIHLVTNISVDVFIGPPCSLTALPVAMQATYYNLPMISWGAGDATLSNSTRFPTFARTVSTWGEYDSFTIVFLYICTCF